MHYEKFADGTVKCIEDEIPFDLPDGWSWERLSNIASFSGGKTPSTSNREFWDGNIPWVTSKDMKSKYISSSLLKLSDKGASQMQVYPCDTILMVTRSGILRHTLPLAILKSEATVNQDIKAISLYDCSHAEWIYACLKGMEDSLLLKYSKSGTTVENINFDEFKYVLLPIPPVSERKRILDCSEKACKAVEVIETEKSDLADVIDKAKAKILDLAIRGQLVPQNSDDEPASVLLERIRAEKENLIKQGKIKRDKRESVIFRGEDNSYYETIGDLTANIDEEIPFDVPDGWAVERLKNIYAVNPKNELDGDTLVSFVPMALVDEQFSGRFTYEEKAWKECRKGFTHFADGDVGFAKISPCFENRKSAIFTDLKNGYGAGTTELFILRSYASTILAEYTIEILKSGYFIDKGIGTFSGVVGQQRVDKNAVFDTIVLIPPHQEQKRIAERVNQLFSVLESIGAALD